MLPSTFLIETHGCQMNEHDSDKIRGLLTHRGMTAVNTLEEADLFILNTCSVREKAAQKVYSRLGQLGARKRARPGFLIGVVGCVAQQEGEEMVKRMPFIDLVVGTHLYHAIPDFLDELGERGRSTRVAVQFLPEILEQPPLVTRAAHFRASVTVMEGCNKRCAFCVVPNTRGPERNRPAGRVLEEVRRAVAEGCVEILLLGQTVNSYKDPTRPGYRFADLLADVATVPGVRRVRFTSPHPRHFTPDLIQAIARHESVCDQVHLPLQSGSSRVLRRMRRQHDRDWYLNLVEQFAASGRFIGLSTDVIVGFPGETESDFEDTLDVIRRVRFEQMFSFKYSVRPRTEAAGWPDDVPEAEKSRRLMILQRLQREIQIGLHQQRYLHRTFEVLTEGRARDGLNAFGRTTTNKIVNFPGNFASGQFHNVTITAAGPNSLNGCIASVPAVPLAI